MKLAEWMTRKDRSTEWVASQLGCTTETVRRYTAGLRIPDRSTMPKIVGLTEGAVTANDFYDIGHAHTADVTISTEDASSGKTDGDSHRVAA